MLESLHLSNVGPAPTMKMDFGERLNLITGDNGLGKSFILDVAWWSLTRTWAREPVIPPLRKARAEIEYAFTKATSGSYAYASHFDRKDEKWSVKNARPAIPGLVLYAQVDGGFSVWDPARNYWKSDEHQRPSAFHFQPAEVWNGTEFCEGLIRDWATWQREKETAYDLLLEVLKVLSPSEKKHELLVPGELKKITARDPKRYPTLTMPYGDDVPVTQVSAGMRRVIALTYLVVWAWLEHIAAAKLRGESPAREIIFLVDEIEAHLHPQWQRRIAPALLKVMDALTSAHGTSVQLIAATHSPLVLASAEPLFDAAKDAWFDLDLENGKVVLRERDFVRLGEVTNWLTSEAFDLGAARSLEAERAIEATRVLFRGTPTAKEIERVHKLLQASLGETDRFWMRWSQYRDSMKGKGVRS